MAKKQAELAAPASEKRREPAEAKEARQARADARQKAPRAEANPSRPNPIRRFIDYVEASRAELRKVTWPTVKETRKATLAVLGFVGIMAIILGLIDLGLSSLIKAILS